jgi:hypothetical protein
VDPLLSRFSFPNDSCARVIPGDSLADFADSCDAAVTAGLC